ncbi:MAG: NUDIX hydrolase [Candidatus Omnitrophica bacterium]|nr:NUDIX hydrolase [Candidatus Omnitrophota bacterium]
MKFKRQFSSGGIVFRKTGAGLRVALISREGGKIWCLPKGLIEKGESVQETALREVREETGLIGKIVRKLGDVSYWYVSDEEGTKFFKKVSFFLLKHQGGNTRHHDFEVDEVAWMPVEKALRKLTYESERRLMLRAKRLVGGAG